MLKQKYVDAAREVRLWLVQVIIPNVALVMVLSNKSVRNTIEGTAMGAVNAVKNRFKK